MKVPRFAIALALGAALLGPLRAQDLDAQLQRAIQRETVTGDLKTAVDEYKKIVAGAGANRAVAAKALVHMAESYQKMGDAEARRVYEQVVRDYGDQKEAVALARARLGGAGRGRQTGPANRQVWTVSAKGDIYSTVSPDGRFIPYVNWNEYGDLFLHDLATGTDRRLTNTATDGKPGVAGEYAEGSAFSRDGKQLAYAWNNEKNRYELRVIGLQGTGVPEPRRLFDNEDVSYVVPDDWSPDGKWLAAQLHRKDRTTQIGLIAMQDGSVRVLKSVDWRGVTSLIFSPDGKYLAYDLPASETAEQRDIFILAIDGSRETAAVVHPSQDLLMGWSPDGKRLLFASDRGGSMGLWSVAVSEGRPAAAPELLKQDIGQHDSMGVSNSGALYYCVRNPGGGPDIRIATFDFTAGKFLSAPVAPIQTFVGTNQTPDWSPDGKYLAYASLRGSAGSVVSRHFIIGIRSVETGQIRELTPSPGFVLLESLAWAPDGRSLFLGGQDAKGREGIFRVDAQHGQSEVVVPRDGNDGPRFVASSTDGKKLYYRSHVPGAPESSVIERDLSSGNERELIRKSFVGAFRLSPDGRYVAAGVADAAAKSAAAVLIPVSGGKPEELMRIDGLSKPGGFSSQMIAVAGWAPDSRSVLLAKVSPTGPESWLVSIGGEQRKIELNLDTTRVFGQLHVHPDGRQVAFQVGGPRKQPEIWVLENFLPAAGK